MKLAATSILAAAVLVSTACVAASPFDGTWRPDPQRMDPNARPDVIELVNGVYACRSCVPPYAVAADGQPHSIEGNPRFDAMSVRVVDEFTVERIGTMKGRTVVRVRTVVSRDGTTRVDTQAIADMGPPAEFALRSERLAAGEPGSHAVSGSWRPVEGDLVNHEEDTTYAVEAGALHMKDRLGRSFVATLDGTDAPYEGDPRYTTVSVRLIDEHTIEEHDKKDGKTVFTARWTVSPDGRTMHVRFEDAHGHVMEQSGRRIR